MPKTTALDGYIEIAESGEALIAGTTMKVVELVTETKAFGFSPEELHFQHPYLKMAQIHAALAYYWDHAADIDQDIEERLRQIEELKKSAPPSALAARLKLQNPK
jgi:uncharacterized protein (DUF433 family)